MDGIFVPQEMTGHFTFATGPKPVDSVLPPSVRRVLNRCPLTSGVATMAILALSAIASISGVHAVGGGVSRAFGALRERIPGAGTASTAGVAVEVGEKQAAVDLDIIVEYGASIVDLAKAVRRNVIGQVERMTGLEVIEVNIAVNDIHLPEDDDESESGTGSRVE